MHPDLSDKSEAIQQVIQKLTDLLGATRFDIVDHWLDDAEAIGIAHPDNYGILAYISTSYLKESGYYVALEASKYHSAFPYQDMGSHDVKTIELLASVIMMHFNMDHISRSSN